MIKSCMYIKVILLLFAVFTISDGYAQPRITALTPSSGIIGTSVTITGTDFGALPADNIVYFGAVRASVTAASSNALTVTVPTGTTYEPVSVTANNLTGYSKVNFNTTLLQPGVFTPASLAPRIDVYVGSSQRKIKSADFDNDGKPDLVLIVYNDVSVTRNTTTTSIPTFTSALNLPAATNPKDIIIADLDGDGKKDIIVSFTYHSYISVFKNITVGNSIDFAPASNFNISGPAGGVTTSDIDVDGKPDIVFTTTSFNKVGVLKNSTNVGSISFNAAIEFTTLSEPSKIICSDLDNDGKEDVIVAYQVLGNISVFHNTSTVSGISLSTRMDHLNGNSPSDITAGDLDGDGKKDIAVANNNYHNVSIFRNITSGTGISLAPKIEFATGISPTSLSITDMNGDGKPDIATANSNAYTISLLRNTSISGNISFAPNLDYPGGQLGISIVLVDINSDNKMDIVAANFGSSSFSILLSKVNEPYIFSFTPSNAIAGNVVTIKGLNFTNTVSVKFGGVAAASFTIVSDTVITATPDTGASGDVAVTNFYSTASLGGFSYGSNLPLPPLITGFSPMKGAVGSQVTITGSNFHPTIAGNIVRFGSVQASIVSTKPDTLIVIVPTGTTFTPITVTVNNLIGYAAHGFDVTFSGGGAPFTQSLFLNALTYNFNSTPYFFSMSDFDGDGKPDYAGASGNSILVRRNTSTGSGGVISFSSQQFNTAETPNDIVTEDFNGDGKPDIAVAHNSAGRVSILQNNSTAGNLAFTSIAGYEVESPGGMSARDLNNDGKPDLVVLKDQYTYTNNRIRVFLNTSSITAISFAPAVSFVAALGNGSATTSAIADFNGDGLPEIAITQTYGPTVISVLKNTTTGNSLSFAPAVNFFSGGFPRQMVVGDIDGDGKPDIAIVASANNTVVSFLRNTSNYSTGNISFANKVDFLIGSQAFGIAIGDIDGDGKPDFAVHQQNASALGLFRNISTPGFFSFESIFDIASNNSVSKVFIIDLNGDGKPEIATSREVLVNNIGVVVPIKLISLNAQEHVRKQIKLSWKTANEQNAGKFRIEHSKDGNDFSDIGSVNALNEISGGSYSFIHSSPSDGVNYYRLKMLDKDGQFSYSYIVRVNLSELNSRFTVYPTTAREYVIAEHPASEGALINMINMSGITMRTILVNKNERQTKIFLEGLPIGGYFLIYNNGIKTMSSKIIIY